MDWDKIDLMFPDGEVTLFNGVTLSKEEILKLKKIETSLSYFAKNMVIAEERLVYYSNGNMDRYYFYNIYPPNQIENRSTLNEYGQKILNDANGVKGFYNEL